MSLDVEDKLYTPPEVFKQLDPLVGADVVLAFRDGILLFHSCVLSQSSETMRRHFETSDIKTVPHRWDLSNYHLTHGQIVKDLLYEGLMFDDVVPGRSKLDLTSRIDLLLKSREIIKSLGLNCILDTIDTWIRDQGGIVDLKLADESSPLTPEDNYSMVQTITSHSDTVEYLPSPPVVDSKTDVKVTNSPKRFHSATENCEQMNCQPTGPANCVTNGSAMCESQSSDEGQEDGYLDESSETSSLHSQLIDTSKIKKEPVEVVEIGVISRIKTPPPVLIECNYCSKEFSTEEQARIHTQVHIN